MDAHHPVFAALATVAVTQTAQTIALSLLLAVWDREALRSVVASWRQSLGAGLFGSLASGGWLIALALAPAAQVRALGVVEAPIAALAGRRLFKERLGWAQVVAGAAVLIGVLMTALA
jgi:drug/metabolite transporter (DMT)-like permease